MNLFSVVFSAVWPIQHLCPPKKIFSSFIHIHSLFYFFNYMYSKNFLVKLDWLAECHIETDLLNAISIMQLELMGPHSLQLLSSTTLRFFKVCPILPFYQPSFLLRFLRIFLCPSWLQVLHKPRLNGSSSFHLPGDCIGTSSLVDCPLPHFSHDHTLQVPCL